MFPRDQKHIINSCTKSIVGILIGIAIDQKKIENVDVPVLEFFPELDRSQVDERLKQLTIKDLLTMRTGWHSQDAFLYLWKGLFRMQVTNNWTEYILDLPFETNPNSRFDYSNMASFLLAAIIEKAVAEDTLSFAEKYLFNPLGIHDVSWEKSPEGTYIGFARMWLKPLDMAKIGLLYLQKGKWEGRQIVSETWVEASIFAHSFPKQYRYIYKENNKIDFGKSGGTWVYANLVRPLSDGYGYQWWLDKSGMFSAIGVGGQYIMVIPKERLVVVATCKLKGKDSFFPVLLLKKYILPAILKKTSLPEDESSYRKLSSYATPPEIQVDIKAISLKSPIAKEISNKVYSLDQSVDLNPWQYDNLSLVIDENTDYALFSCTLHENDKITFEIGLNNQYRIISVNGKTYAAKGEWTTANVFTINYELVGYASKGKWVIQFNDDSIDVKEVGVTGENNYKGRIKAE